MLNTAAPSADDAYPMVGEDTNWLAVAQRVASLYEPAKSGGQPSHLTDVYRVNRLLKHLADGNYIETAVQAAGISKQTFYNWQQQAKEGNCAAIVMMDAIEKARAEAESSIVADVRKAAKKEQFWAAGITLLERTRPERFGRKADENSGPKVVVQVGGSATDVKVLISGVGEVSPPTFASLAPSCSTPNHLETQAFAEPSSHITAIMVTQPEAEKKPQPARRRAKALRATRAHGSPVGTGVEAGVPTDNFSPVKGGR